MRYIIYVCLAFSLTACISTNKLRPETTLYDFGLDSTATPIVASVELGQVTAIEPVDHKRIRYRLDYKNPSQVFTYSESRWAGSPPDLLTAKLRNLVTLSGPSNCTLKMQIEAFDHLFETAERSASLVKLHLTLQDTKSRQTLAMQQVKGIAPAATPDSKGGVAAMDQAATVAIISAVEWANKVSTEKSQCKA